MSSPQELLTEVREQTSTHSCPQCKGPAYCAMEAGKSPSACWCMGVSTAVVLNSEDDQQRCYCKRCLTETQKT